MKWKALPDADLSTAVLAMFKSLPSTLGSLLYISSASLGCIARAGDTAPVFKQCGNPLAPSLQIGCFIALAWNITYIFSPITKEDRGKNTWADIMLLRMSKIEGMQFSIFCITATICWM